MPWILSDFTYVIRVIFNLITTILGSRCIGDRLLNENFVGNVF